MFETTLSSIYNLSIHQVGNPLKEEDLVISNKPSGMDALTEKHLWKYLESAFKTPYFYRFTHPAGLELNNVYSICKEIFRNPEDTTAQSAKLAKLLYDRSQHPHIKAGEFMVIYFKNLGAANIQGDAIGLFKSEKKQAFFFTEEQNSVIDLFSYKGINPQKVDKACLIFQQEEADGYQVLAVDNINRGEEAKFWFDEFLKISPRSTDYSRTDQFLSITKKFIEREINEDDQRDRAEGIDLLNRSYSYFQESEEFSFDDFNEKVLQNDDLSDRFRSYTRENDKEDLIVEESFSISGEAVKKKSRIFKSILKLDKNFHVYIHGQKDKIEKGVEADGRKYYKLYYEEEA